MLPKIRAAKAVMKQLKMIDVFRPNLSANKPVGTSNAKIQNRNQDCRRRVSLKLSPPHPVKKGIITASKNCRLKRKLIIFIFCIFANICNTFKI